jgi:hypothetical protein
MDASILHGACGGYMARLSRHRDRASAGLIPCLADPALERLRRACARPSPAAAAASRAQLEKEGRGSKWWEAWVEGGGAENAMIELRDAYFTMKLAQRWCARALAFFRSNQDVLRQSVDGGGDTRFSDFSAVLGPAMDVVCDYVRLHLFLAGCADALRLSVALYAHAVLLAPSGSGTPEPAFAQIAEFLARVGQREITRKLVADFEDVAPCIARCVAALRPAYDCVQDTQGLDRGGALDIMHRQGTMFNPALEHEREHRYLAACGRLRDWILFGSLVCPAALIALPRSSGSGGGNVTATKTPALAFLTEVLRDGFTLRIYRDLTMTAAELFIGLFSWFPAKRPAAPGGGVKLKFPKGVKPKKMVEACEVVAAETSWARHAERRRLCVRVLQNIWSAVRHTPGLVAPRFMTLLNALAFARAEVVWHFMHRGGRTLLTKKSSKALNAATSQGKIEPRSGLEDKDPNVSALMYLIERVAAHLRKHRVLISRYYHEYLQGADCAAMGALLRQLEEQGYLQALSPATQGALKRITHSLAALPAPDVHTLDQTVDLVPLRVSWYRCLEDMARHLREFTASGDGVGSKLFEDVLTRGNRIEAHSRWVDSVASEVSAVSNLATLWWCPGTVDDHFEMCLSSHDACSKHVAAFLGVFRAAPRVLVHRYCPEDHDLISRQAIERAQHYLNRVAQSVSIAFSRVLANMQWLEDQASPLESALYLCQRQRKSSADLLDRRGGGGGGRAATDQAAAPAPLPGSPAQTSRDAQRLRLLDKEEANARNLCYAMQSGWGTGEEDDTEIVIFDRVFFPNNILRTLLRRLVRESITTIVKASPVAAVGAQNSSHNNSNTGKYKSSFGENVVRPTILLRRVKRVSATLMRIASLNFDMDIERVVREELLRNGFDKNVANIGNTQLHNRFTGVSSPDAMVYEYGRNYIDLIETLLATRDTDQTAGLCYSAFRGGFVRIEGWADRVAKGQSVPAIEQFATLPEFVALCELIGPQGMRCIEHSMLHLIEGHTSMVRMFLETNRRVLTQIRDLMSRERADGTQLLALSTSLSDTELLLKHSISMGHALRLRELIQEAIRRVMRRKVPLVYETAKLAHLQYAENIELCKEFETMDCVLRECGIDVGAADHPLISVIRNVHTGDRDCNALWSLLPFAYGSSFTSKYWAACKQVSGRAGVGGCYLVLVVLGVFLV